MNGSFLQLAAERSGELLIRTGEHIVLTGLSTGTAVLVGIPLGILVHKKRWLRGPVLGAVGVLQTIPSLAMLTILLVLLGQIGMLPAVAALVMYALLPIVVNTQTGLEEVPAGAVEAATGCGMSGGQLLRLVELPLALPVIVAGVRTAAVVSVGIATLSAFIGAGGLGQFINEGLALLNTELLLLGAVPAALLALLVHFLVGAAGKILDPHRRKRRRAARIAALMAPIAILLAALTSQFMGTAAVRIGCKNFGEQLILGELLAQLVEERCKLSVIRHFNLGGTMVCHQALTHGQIDVYPEYTGTGLVTVLGAEPGDDPAHTYKRVKEGYVNRFGLEWLAPLGFDNTYAITVRRADAESRGWTTLSGLVEAAGDLRAGFTDEFARRADGYPGLSEAYGLRFSEVINLAPTLMYEALESQEVDVICAFATDGRIEAYDLVVLQDDRGFFPPYHAAFVVRPELFDDFPEVRAAAQALDGLIDDGTMRRLNYEVDGRKRTPADVAHEFLRTRGLTAR